MKLIWALAIAALLVGSAAAQVPQTVRIAGFTPATTGTPISVTTGGVSGTLPAGITVIASNVGSTNIAYCKLGASATTSDQAIQPGSWFAFTPGSATQLTCITSTSTTTVNMVGGSGLPTGSGGGGGGGGSASASVGATGAAVPSSADYVGINVGGNLTGVGGVTAGADAVSNTATGLYAYSRLSFYNGTTWDRAVGDTTNGLWVNVKSATGVAKNTAYGSQTASIIEGLVNTVAPSGGTDGNLDFPSLTTYRSTRVQPAAPAATTMQSAAVASGNGTSLDVAGFEGVALNILCSVTCSGGTTINFEKSVDDTTWVAASAWLVGTSGVSVTTTTAPGDFILNAAGYKSVRARISAYSAGTITIKGYQTAASINRHVVDSNVFFAGTAAVGDPCQTVAKTYTPISITTATTTRIVAPAASKRTYICYMVLTSAAADNVGIVEGTGGTCGSGTAGVIGGTTAANGPNFAANGGVALGNGGNAVAATAGTNVDLCLITSASTPLAGHIAWVQAP